MTRIRAGEGCVPSERMVRYYSQRASAGLIITEGTHPSPMGRGYTLPARPAHGRTGGRLAESDRCRPRCRGPHLRPTHARRACVPLILPAGSRLARRTFGHRHLWGNPHLRRESAIRDAPPLETEEIPAVIEEYRRAAELSITAGFDGVELHAATGYLPNQFQVTGSNRRTDAYGGSLERRTRFTLEVIEGLCSVRGADRVGIKIAPGFTVNDTFDDDPAETYTYLVRCLNPLGLAYLHVGYDGGYGRGTAPPFNPIDLLRPVYAGTLLAVGGFNKATGEGGDNGGPGRCRCLWQAVHLQSRPRGEVSARRSLEPLGRADVLRRGRSRLYGLPHAENHGMSE